MNDADDGDAPCPASRHAVVIGSSADGLRPLLDICAALPADFPAPVLVVLHIGSHRSQLPAMLNRRCALEARFAIDAEPVLPGTIYVAPPDHHLLLLPKALRLSRGPKENWTRPSIDPLFRSAALHWGDCTVGVLLAGQLDDGVSGLHAIKRHGGTAVVQDPASALDASMPQAALDQRAVDFCLQPAEIAPRLERLVQMSRPARPLAPAPDLVREVQISEGASGGLRHMAAMGHASQMACPECDGTLFELHVDGPLRYRCQAGHAFSALSLKSARHAGTQGAIESGVRSLQEREALLRRAAAVARLSSREHEARVAERRADEVHETLAQLVRLIEVE